MTHKKDYIYYIFFFRNLKQFKRKAQKLREKYNPYISVISLANDRRNANT